MTMEDHSVYDETINTDTNSTENEMFLGQAQGTKSPFTPFHIDCETRTKTFSKRSRKKNRTIKVIRIAAIISFVVLLITVSLLVYGILSGKPNSSEYKEAITTSLLSTNINVSLSTTIATLDASNKSNTSYNYSSSTNPATSSENYLVVSTTPYEATTSSPVFSTTSTNTTEAALVSTKITTSSLTSSSPDDVTNTPNISYNYSNSTIPTAFLETNSAASTIPYDTSKSLFTSSTTSTNRFNEASFSTKVQAFISTISKTTDLSNMPDISHNYSTSPNPTVPYHNATFASNTSYHASTSSMRFPPTLANKVNEDPVVFVSGKYNFTQAKYACANISRKLASKEDLERAFHAGYERCEYGWLEDQHAGYVMQESGARPACGGGVVGVIYFTLKDPESIVGGANCAPNDFSSIKTITPMSTVSAFNGIKNTTNISYKYSSSKNPATFSGSSLVVSNASRRISTTSSNRIHEDPVVFVSGKYNFTQAKYACANISRKLASKEDLERAFQAGYERCEYGWLEDQHAGYVMQESGARPACGGGVVGVIYSTLKDPNSIVGGANCAPNDLSSITTTTSLATISASNNVTNTPKISYNYPSSTNQATSSGNSSVVSSTLNNASTSSIRFFTISTNKTNKDPVVFVSGKYNFTQAKYACANISRKLASKEDLERAFQAGYERCEYGWLEDQHAGYVMQESGARPACGGGVVGVIYSTLKDPESIVGGANCAPNDLSSITTTVSLSTTFASNDVTNTPNISYNYSSLTNPATSSGNDSVISTTPYVPSTSSTTFSTTSSNRINEDPVVFVSGKYNFTQAKYACANISRNLASKDDLERAFHAGYERCEYGWLEDQHAGYVMQESGARPACGGGVVGVIYSTWKDPESIVGGANCAPNDPIVFVSGQFDFARAVNACENIGRKLALKEDLNKAFLAGYEKCEYGWLEDQHAGYVMQESGARPACGGGVVGVIYSTLKDPESIVGGANCAPIKQDTYRNSKRSISNHNKSVNWWVSMDPADIYNLKHLLSFAWNEPSQVTASKVARQTQSKILLEALRTVYPCCSYLAINVTSAGNTTVDFKIPPTQMRYLAETYKKEFGNSRVKVYPQITASFEAMIEHGAATINRSRTIEDLVNKTILSGIDGIIFDYEPTTNYTRHHAEIYRDFIDALVDKLEPRGIKVAMLVASWGILKHYEVYSQSKCEIIGSMSNTYYGHNITYNIQQVKHMLEWIDTDRLQVGIGAMYVKSRVTPKRSYKWNQKQLKLFLDWLNRIKINQVHVFPGQWGGERWVERYFVRSLVNFVLHKNAAS